jgi:hypothetical protein
MLKRFVPLYALLAFLLFGCQLLSQPASSTVPPVVSTGVAGTLSAVRSGTPLATAVAAQTQIPSVSSIPPTSPTPLPPTPTPTQTVTPTPNYPPQGYGPANFPSNVDPLTGLAVGNPALLARRPLAIKVSNLPRDNRPQWGLSLADLVFEYYTEEGTTRFIGLWLGNDASRVGPIRSARFFDIYVVRGYKAVFAFGYAYVAEMDRLLASEFANRLVVEGAGTPLTRYNPSGSNDLVVNTADLSAYITRQGVPNGPQNLNGMFFNLTPSPGGVTVNHVFVRYSSAIYNRWDYDPTSGRYLRFSDTADNTTGGIQNEQYAQLTDRLTGQPIACDNLVVIYVNHELYSPGIYDILLTGQGVGYAFRDGQAYVVRWQRNYSDVVSLSNPDGTPYAMKPGTTWFEVIGVNSSLQQTTQGWRFTHKMP